MLGRSVAEEAVADRRTLAVLVRHEVAGDAHLGGDGDVLALDDLRVARHAAQPSTATALE